MNTSGGINKNIDSQTVNMNTIQEYARLSDLLSIYSANFMYFFLSLSKNLLDSKLISYNLQYIMMKRQNNSNRGARVASKVQTLVAEILRDNYSDDKLVSGVSLVGAVAHGGLQFVRLFYYSRNTDIVAVQRRLGEITKSVRYELGARMNQKYVPDIRFEYDDTLDRAERIDKLLNKLDEK